MTKKFKQSITAAELMETLKRDPEWVRKDEERKTQRTAVTERILAEERPLLADLAAAGYEVKSVSALVNASWNYPAAIPVLRKHLRLPYDPIIREAVIRALTVPESRGIAAREILEELKTQETKNPPAVQWALANALTVVADAGMVDDLRALLKDARYKDLHKILRLALSNLKARIRGVKK